MTEGGDSRNYGFLHLRCLTAVRIRLPDLESLKCGIATDKHDTMRAGKKQRDPGRRGHELRRSRGDDGVFYGPTWLLESHIAYCWP